ncbi:MAG: hypothetical protein JOZ42_09875 [Acetobacteraceae bacterium]|nr:hypothetical protein [Acetobacteraceae bacterium]
MTADDQRNTLIVELVSRTRDNTAFYQGLNDTDLAGAGSLLVFLREAHRRSDADLKTMSADDMRNTTIVELAAQTHRAGPDLQAQPNLELARLLLGPERSYIRGVLLVGKFRNQLELDAMSGEDQRNTLIVELANRTGQNVPFYQGQNDADLAGMGALLVYLRHVQSRTDAQIKTMSADDMRNTVIVEIHAQTRRSDLQALTNLQLAMLALGLRALPNTDNLPEALRPGQHVMIARVSQAYSQTTTRSFSDVPFVGLFIGRDVDCTHGFQIQAPASPVGAGFTGFAGWGQVEGDGHPGASKDSCLSWVSRLMLDFDLTAFRALPSPATFQRAVLAYNEQEAPACAIMVYTQGGFLADALPCWTSGGGAREAKATGCLTLKIPNEHWIANPPGNRLIGWQDWPPAGRAGPSSWDVTQVIQARTNPGIGQQPIGDGFMLLGEITDVGNLNARDNTRCASQLSDVRVEITYTIPPVQETYDPPPIK